MAEFRSAPPLAATIVTLVVGIIGLFAFIVTWLHPNLGGGWILENQTETTAYTPFKGLNLTYEIFLTQNGTGVKGSGERMTENERPLAATVKTHIDISGTVGIMSVDAIFQEKGTVRISTGAFHWWRKLDGSREGIFESDAAKSSGSSSI